MCVEDDYKFGPLLKSARLHGELVLLVILHLIEVVSLVPVTRGVASMTTKSIHLACLSRCVTCPYCVIVT